MPHTAVRRGPDCVSCRVEHRTARALVSTSPSPSLGRRKRRRPRPRPLAWICQMVFPNSCFLGSQLIPVFFSLVS